MSLSQIIAENKVISAEEEAALWKQFMEDPGNSEIRVRLVESYLLLVLKVANKLPFSIRQKIPVEELFGAGVIGLHEAISSFSEEKKVLFSTFAYKRIRGAIMDELRSQDHLTRTQRNYYKEICAAINRLTAQLSRPPTDAEIAEASGLTIAQVDKYIGIGSKTVSLDDEMEGGLSYQDLIVDSKAISPEEYAHQSLALERLRHHFRELEEREQKILFLRHYEEMSVKEIAKVLEISEGRISQIYQKIVLKLRALMNSV
ncbi:MAG: hypothetical protein A2017_07400 [Lentisphaerae bacterium GWF2_44_16]|nr:MAG: hypothetical protein A2017_07400 [Lentisphaerae bacterium GWF2_44_16]